MDLSPGNRTLPETFLAGFTRVLEPCFMVVFIGCGAEWGGCETRALNPCTCLHSRLLQDAGGDFLQAYCEFEHRRFRSTSPSNQFPMCADKCDIRMCGEIENQ